MKTKLLSMMLALVMVILMLPAAASAADTGFTFEKIVYANTDVREHDGTLEVYYIFNGGESTDDVVNIDDIGMQVSDELEKHFPLDAGGELYGAGGIFPGDNYLVKVHIQNNSSQTLHYSNNSLYVDAVKKVEEPAGVPSTGFHFKDYELSLSRISLLNTKHRAIRALSSEKLDDGKTRTWDSEAGEWVPKLYPQYLNAKGYTTPETALSDWFLHYYKEEYSETKGTVNEWDDLWNENWTKRATLRGNMAQNKDNLVLIMPRSILMNLSGNRVDNFIWGYGQVDATNDAVDVRWPDERLAALGFYMFFDDLVSIDFEATESSPNADYGKGILDYVDVGDGNTSPAKARAPYLDANNYLAKDNVVGSIPGGETGEFQFALTVDIAGMGNMYRNIPYKNLFNLGLGFTVEEDVTSVQVTKQWIDNNNASGKRPDEIQVQLLANNKPYGDPVALNASSNWTYIFENLPKASNGTDIVYTVSESAVKGYTTDIIGNAADGFVITNVHVPAVLTGGLTVSKSVSGNAADPTKAFPFIVTLNDQGISGAYGEMTFSNGIASFVLKDGESKTASGLPAGVAYIVTESGNDGYVVTVNGGSETTASGVVVADQVAVAAFNNFKAGSNVPTPTPDPPVADLPQTGDNSHIALWGVMLMLSAAGVFILLGKRRLDGTR